MPTEGTTVGPLTPETRDRVKAYRDDTGQPHYEATLRKLLEEVNFESNGD